MPKFEEYKVLTPFWGWVILWGLSLFIIGYGMMLHVLVREGPRHWEFYSVPTTPAESEYSTRPPPASTSRHMQIEPLPEGMRITGSHERALFSCPAASEGATP